MNPSEITKRSIIKRPLGIGAKPIENGQRLLPAPKAKVLPTREQLNKSTPKTPGTTKKFIEKPTVQQPKRGVLAQPDVMKNSKIIQPGTSKKVEDVKINGLIAAPKKPSILDLAKSNKGFINPGQIAEDLGIKPKLSNSFREKNSRFYEGNTEQVARERFNIPNLKKIGRGSDRDVYDIGDGKVLKVIKSARGIGQTLKDYYLEDAGVIPKTFEYGKNYVVAEKIKTYKEATPAEKKKLDTLFKDASEINSMVTNNRIY